MASFNQHISGGFLIGIVGAITSLLLLSISLVQGIVVFIFIVFGSILPDIDSDTSKPIQIIFGAAGIIIPVVTYQFFFSSGYRLENLLCYIVFGYLIIRYIVAKIFFKFTDHRGIIHSIPFAIICGEITYLLFSNSPMEARILFAGACTIGVFVHLIMDEMWSVDVSGLKIKKSFGSALALKAKSSISTLLFYIIIVILGVFVILLN